MKKKANHEAKKQVAAKAALSPDEAKAKAASAKILQKAAAAGVVHPTAKATSTKLLKQAAASGSDPNAKKLLKKAAEAKQKADKLKSEREVKNINKQSYESSKQMRKQHSAMKDQEAMMMGNTDERLLNAVKDHVAFASEIPLSKNL